MLKNLSIKLADFGVSFSDLRSAAIAFVTLILALFILSSIFVFIRTIVFLIKDAMDKNAEEKIEEEPKITTPAYKYDTGLILDLFNRGVSDFKIGQIIMKKCNHSQTKSQILQFVSNVKNFIFLCKEGNFSKDDLMLFARGDYSVLAALGNKSYESHDIELELNEQELDILGIIESNYISNMEKTVENIISQQTQTSAALK